MYEPMTIRLNDGQIVTRPYREAVSLLSRRLADPVPAEEAEDFVPLEESPGEAPEARTEVDPSAPDLNTLTKAELVDYAGLLFLPTSGNKDDLIARIAAHLSATTVEDDLDDLVGVSPEDEPGEDSDDFDGGN